MFAAQQKRGIVVLARNIGCYLRTLRLQGPVERPQMLDRNNLRIKTVQPWAGLCSQKQNALALFRHVEHFCGKGMEKGFDCVTAHWSVLKIEHFQ